MTIRFPRLSEVPEVALSLSPGDHKTPEAGLCAMEAAAWLAGLPHSDRPSCTTEVIAAYIRYLNDNMPDDVRPRLVAYLPRIIGIPGDDFDHLRNEVFARHAVQRFAPAALRHAGHEDHALRLESESRFIHAKQVAGEIVYELGDTGPDMAPIQWAVHHAGEAAGLADWFTSKRDAFFKGASSITPYGKCAEAAAKTAFQAWRVGCNNIWDMALLALDEVLLVG